MVARIGFKTASLPGSPPACNTLYLVREYWPASYEKVRSELRNYFRPQSVTGVALINAVRLNKSALTWPFTTVSVTLLQPHPLFYGALLNVLRAFVLVPQIPIDVWVYSEAPTTLEETLKSPLPLRM
jgi:hypothetical protein